MTTLQLIANNFCTDGAISSIQNHGNGLINSTYKVETENGKTYIFQKLNSSVFSNPELILNNISVFYQHLDTKTNKGNSEFVFPGLVATKSKSFFYIDEDKNYWRMMQFIENSLSFNSLNEVGESKNLVARQVGLALGRFHRLGRDIELAKLHDTLPGFHIAPGYLKIYDEIDKESKSKFISDKDVYCQGTIEASRADFFILEHAKSKKLINESLIHGDPKLNNILFRQDSHHAMSLIDLDTLKPGLWHYDIGDALRSLCNLLGESPSDVNDISFDLSTAKNFFYAYFEETKHFLSSEDYRYIYPAVKLLPLELGTRFYTDHLSGNHYFKVSKEKENLDRACCQFRLAQSIESKREKIECMINKHKDKESI